MKVLNKYKDQIPSDAVCIMRGHPLGNPFILNIDGDRPTVFKIHKQWFVQQLVDNNPVIINALKELKYDSKIWCCCKPHLCHGDTIKDCWEEIMELGDNDFDKGLEQFCKENKKSYTYIPANDGHDHINIYSKARTALGYLMSNFARTPFMHPEYGDFLSIEGFWYWLGSGKKHDQLRTLHGFEAKKFGLKLKKKHIDDFDAQVEKAIELKVEQNPALKTMLRNSELPFTHYYWYGEIANCKVIEIEDGNWLVGIYERIRQELKQHSLKLIIAGSRTIKDYKVVEKAYLESGYIASEIVCGEADGPDKLGRQLAEKFGIPVASFPADWENKGKAAGYIRNVDMSVYGDALLLLYDGISKGSRHMLEIMKQKNKPVKVRLVSPQ